MYLHRLSVSNFKNIQQGDLEFSPVLNCFVGDNGEGKTNLLDGIYYLSMCKSHFKTTDTQNIKDQESYFILKGQYKRKEDEDEVLCGVKRVGGKTFKLNGKEYDRLSDHIGFLPLVIVTPADTSLIHEGSEERRKFLNTVISQTNKEYLNALLRYNQVLIQRNKLLKSNLNDAGLFDVFNTQLSDYGTIIFEKRKHLLEYFTPIFQEIYTTISGQEELVVLNYKSDLENSDLKDLLQKNMERDSILQYTSVGIHRDDLVMELNGRSVRYSASQGQQKSFLIAMRLAQFRLIKEYLKISPILLLDDIFDKLDVKRVEKLVSLVSENGFGQIFLTDSNKNRLDSLLLKVAGNYRLFNVKQGNIQLIQSS